MSSAWSIFDVIGPVMIGPSSSHTAGACLLGYMAQAIYGPFTKVDMYLHGSFAEVYKGHFTDTALLGGILGMQTYDENLKNSFAIASAKGISYQFIPTHLGDTFHPNTVKFVFDDNEKRIVVGSSLGGGKVVVNFVGKIPVSLSLEHSLFLALFDTGTFDPSSVLDQCKNLGKSVRGVNTFSYKDKSLLVIQMKEMFTNEDRAVFAETQGVLWVRCINHLSHFA